MKKTRREFLLKDDDYKYIEQIKEENNLSYPVEALSLIIREHSQITNQAVANILIEEISKKIENELKKIRISANKNNRNSEVILEWLNGMSIKENYSPFYTREEKWHDGLKELEKIVDKKMEKQRNKSLDSKF